MTRSKGSRRRKILTRSSCGSDNRVAVEMAAVTTVLSLGIVVDTECRDRAEIWQTRFVDKATPLRQHAETCFQVRCPCYLAVILDLFGRQVHMVDASGRGLLLPNR